MEPLMIKSPPCLTCKHSLQWTLNENSIQEEDRVKLEYGQEVVRLLCGWGPSFLDVPLDIVKCNKHEEDPNTPKVLSTPEDIVKVYSDQEGE